ncbi:ferric-dicitrate binding protein FerR (iron transport regulator) [Pedobacter cryoconitis]|uniref:FecR family protein n=1 Tax=Pedobacter cryoconitis TaxID=188932 RepID=UPI00161CB3C2|nr:FecR domain-containing protein [Pedobacter cryoconitis]MBB6270406.1 ferric-dicitrate binding protein FerR (iron transport regulator) [Pedobacter cryoconitis]
MKSKKLKKFKAEFLKAVEAYLEGTADEDQILFLDQYFDLFEEVEEILEYHNLMQTRNVGNLMHSRIHQDITRWEDLEKKSEVVTGSTIKYWYMAAATVFVTVTSVYIYQANQNKFESANQYKVASIVPGRSKAILTLSNGSKIILADSKNGEIANQSGTIVTKKDSQLVYQRSSSSAADKYASNAVETPKGGQYELVLPDGTKVWLNAASSLRYPLAFQGNERKVELTGEAYFEVAKDKTRPFKVHSNNQVVEVLGTHFNINVYSNEPFVKTTLLEGSVRVTNSSTNAQTIIRPGEQSIIQKAGNSAIKVKNVDMDEAVAWKNGYFMFNSEQLESVLRKISRWYDVDIQYQNEELKHQLFSGTLSKYLSVSQVLKKLELLQSVHFKTEGRKIIVTPYSSK